jgi:hypothetical protein
MRTGRRIPAGPLHTLGILLLATCAASCSKSTSPDPPPPVTGPTFDFRFPAQNVSHEFQFVEAGDWDYVCRPHVSSGMVGTIRVRETSTRDSALVSVGLGGFNFAPDTVTIKLNGTIRWVNVSTVQNHTASRP